MKKRIADLFSYKKLRRRIAALALTAVIGGVSLGQIGASVPVMADPIVEETSEKEEALLAATPKTTTKTTKKTSKKKVKLGRAASKTYTQTLPTKTETSTQTTKSPTEIVETQTTVKTSTREKYTKKSRVKVVITTVKTTVKTTTTPLTTSFASEPPTPGSAGRVAPQMGRYEVSVTALAPRMDARVLKAYQTMGFKVYVDSSVSYGGYFDSRDRTITLREEGDNIYHELGHFLAFISGNTDRTSSFINVYNQEKARYVGYNKTYVTKDSAEYFAESTRDYILDGAGLKSSRPNTYAAIESALSSVTDGQIAKIMKIYSSVWK